jgi:hypothetical protein
MAVSNEQEERKPPEWSRAIWIFSFLPAIIIFLSIFKAILKPPSTPNSLYLLALWSIATLLAWIVGRDIWALRVRVWPGWIEALLYTVSLGGLAVLIFLRESGIYVWNTIYLDVPFVWCSVLIAVVAWLTEKRKGVRVYLGARRLRFVHASSSV